jgi:hypothetical protein
VLALYKTNLLSWSFIVLPLCNTNLVEFYSASFVQYQPAEDL